MKKNRNVENKSNKQKLYLPCDKAANIQGYISANI